MATEAEAKIGHTPPPWREGVEGNNRVYGPDGCGADSGLVAVVYKGRANVSLVSAAPDLLLSLKDAIDIIEKHVPRDALGVDHMGDFSVPGGVMTWAVLDEHLHYMRKAIAKAEGRS